MLLGLLAVAAVAALASSELVVRVVAGAVAALAFGVLLGWRIVRPLRRLARATDALADGCPEAPRWPSTRPTSWVDWPSPSTTSAAACGGR